MQFPVLQYLDVVIGLAVVMIVVATFVTALTQFILSATYSRARHLRDGLHSLVQQLDPDKLSEHARYLSELVLRDESVGSVKLIPWFTKIRNWFRSLLPGLKGETQRIQGDLPARSPASVIQREELVLLLLKLMSQAPAGDPGTPKDQALKQLVAATQSGGAFSAAAELQKIQKEILNQELTKTGTLASMRSAAILKVVKQTEELRDFVAKVNAWYDNTMDRVIANFALEARIVTTVVAFGTCIWLQLDSIALVKRLSTDATYRNAIVSQAKDLGVVAQDPKKEESPSSAPRPASDQPGGNVQTANPPPTGNPPAATDPTATANPPVVNTPVAGTTANSGQSQGNSQPVKTEPCGGLPVEKCREEVVKKLAQVKDLNLLPDQPGISIKAIQWSPFGIGPISLPTIEFVNWRNWHWPGLLLSWVLVSLGAPFWFDVLKNTMNLRSTLAQKDDKDRKDRRSPQPGSPSNPDQT